MKAKGMAFVAWIATSLAVATFHPAGVMGAVSASDGLATHREFLASTLKNPFFAPLIPADHVPGVNDAAYLSEIFADAESAIAALVRLGKTPYEAMMEVQYPKLQAVEDFLLESPNSIWAPSLRSNLGLHYRRMGLFTLAMDHWENAWMALKSAETPRSRRIAEEVAAQYSSLLASLGRVEQLEPFFREVHAMPVKNLHAAAKLRTTLEAFVEMVHTPGKSYRCGSLALAHFGRALYGAEFHSVQLHRLSSPATGFSVRHLVDVAGELNMRVQGVFRAEGEHIPVPSVIHWEQNHYAAIVKEVSPGLYRVVDPTFGHSMLLKADVINYEASGVFIIAQGDMPRGFRQMAKEEMEVVFGRGNPNFIDDEEDHKCKGTCPNSCPPGNPPGGPPGPPGSSEPPGSPGSNPNDGGDMENMPRVDGGNGPDCNGCGSAPQLLGTMGMVGWRVSEPYLNLWLEDTPFHYQPSKGPPVSLRLSYNSRNPLYPESTVTSFGDGWYSSFLSYARIRYFNGSGEPGLTTFYLDQGGVQNVNFDGGPVTNYLDNVVYSYTMAGGDISRFEQTHVDGSKQVYGFRRTNGSGYAAYFFLSEVHDRFGNKLVYNYDTYDPNTMEVKLVSITDADSRTTTIHYIPYTYQVESVEDPFGRTVEFDYSSGTLLTGITDTEGLESQITYSSGSYSDIASITTPYGTTSFVLTDASSGLDSLWERRATITHPDGSKERYLFRTKWHNEGETPNSLSSDKVPQDTPYDTLENTALTKWNSYYWNRQQYAQLSSTFKSTADYDDLTDTDKLISRWRHWLGGADDFDLYVPINTLSSERLPSPDGTTWGAMTWYDYADKENGDPTYRGPQVMPSVIARVMPDGSTWYEWHLRNSKGFTTNLVEKWEIGGTDYFRTNKFVYDSNGIDLLHHIGPGGHVEVGYAYNSSHPRLPIRMTNALGEVTLYSYNTNQQITAVEYPSGQKFTYSYGTNGYLASMVESISSTPIATNSYTWEHGLVKTQTNPRGLTRTNSYDGLSRLTKIEFSGMTNAMEYRYTNGVGSKLLDLTAAKDLEGNWTYYQYNSVRQLTKVTLPNGVETAYAYCDCGGPSFITNAVGTAVQTVTQNVYDYQGRLTHTYFPNGTSRTNVFDSLGRVVVSGAGLGWTTNHFDNLGRLSSVSNYFGQVAKFEYDIEDQLTNQVDASGVAVSLSRDLLHRVTLRTHPDSTTEGFGYTANFSQPTAYTNQAGSVTLYSYDALQRKTNEVHVGVMTNRFTYGAAGDLLTLTDGRNKTTTWAYDEWGRATNKVLANSVEVLRYSYDKNSRLTNRWSKAKLNTAYSYDQVGNLTNVNYNASADIRYKYDALGRLTNMVDAAGTSHFTYDGNGNLLTEDGPWSSDMVTLTHNEANQVRTLTVQQPVGSWVVTNSYDAALRLTQVESPAGIFAYTHESGVGAATAASPLIRKIGLPNSGWITNVYDTLGRLADTSLRSSTNVVLNQHQYQYSGHLRSKMTRTDGSYQDYTHDGADQLKTALTYTSGGTPIGAENRGYVYDAGGNLSTRTNNLAVQSFGVDSVNQLNSSPVGTVAYDDNGNLTTRSTATLSYDDENQLTRVLAPSSHRVDFTYDGRGRLRVKAEYSPGIGTNWTLSAETRYVYHGRLVVQERAASNTPTVAYTRGVDLSGTMEGAGGIGGLLARSHGYSGGAGTWSTHHAYHADGGGNITALVASNQTLSATYKYDPYGRSVSTSGSMAAANTQRFSSKEIIPSTGFYYYGYRFYDPEHQRWLNRDPIEEAGGVNLYAFVNNDPINDLDNDGLAPHKKKRKSTWDKHTARRSGRPNTLQRQKPGWVNRKTGQRVQCPGGVAGLAFVISAQQLAELYPMNTPPIPYSKTCPDPYTAVRHDLWFGFYYYTCEYLA